MSIDSELPQGKRQFLRCRFNGRIGVLSSTKFQTEIAAQIGEGGLLFEASNEYQVGQILELSFILPTSKKLVVVSGEVVYILDPEQAGANFVGVKFNSPDHETQMAIRRFVALRSRRGLSSTDA